jgi:hypothetical protein
MTIKLKATISKAEVIIRDNNNFLKLTVSDLLGLKSDNSTAISSFINKNNTSVTKQLNNINSIEIACSNYGIAFRIARLIDLRNGLKDNNTANDSGKLTIFLNNIKAGGDEITVSLSDNNKIIQLNDNDFDEGFGINRINIGISGSNDWNITENLGDFQTVWQELEKILDKCRNSLLQTNEIENALSSLNNYWIKKSDSANNSIEKKIYNLGIKPQGLGNINSYKEAIDFGIKFFSELKVWKECGFNTTEEVKSAIGNGFVISDFNIFQLNTSPTKTIGNGKLIEKQENGVDKDNDAESNITKIKSLIKNKKFAGVQIDVASSNGSFKPTVKQLEAFCSENWFGEKHDNIDYPARIHESEPSKTRGFKPNDIKEGGKCGTRSENMRYNNFVSGKRCTKIALDILGAPSLQAAVELAFFGKHYIADNLKDERYQDGSESLLYFNEVEGLDEIQTLEFYYQVLKDPNCGDNKAGTYDTNANELNTNGNDWKGKNYINEPSNKPSIDRNYRIVETFIKLYIKAKSDKNQIAELNKYNVSGNPSAGSEGETKKKLYEHWKNKIEELKTDSKVNYETKRKKMLTIWTNDPYKSVLESSEIINDADIQLLNELEILFKLLKGAYEIPPTTKKYQLNSYNDLTDNQTDNKKKIQKKLWDIIQAQKVGGSTMSWGEEAISKAKVENIEDIRIRIKGKMNKVGNDVYDKIVKNNNKIKNDVAKLRQVEEIFDIAEQAWKESKVNSYLFNSLNDSEKDASKKDAWEAVNSYQKKWENNQWVDSAEGFATGALKRLKNSSDISKKFNDFYNEADSADKLDTKLQDYINSDEFKKMDSVQQTRFRDIIKPRNVAAKRIDTKNNKNSDETKLVNLLRLDDLGVEYEDSKEGLTEIEKDLKFLNEVKGSSSGDKFNARKDMGDNTERILTFLIDEMTEKRNYLKTKHQDSTNEQDGDGKKDDSLLKNPWFIITAIIILVIFGLVVYLIKSKSKDEEENLIV